jgi:AraC-like DNA-binding protein
VDGRGITFARHDSELGWWETATRRPHPALRRHVLSYAGYRERTAGPLFRREVPWAGVVLIFGFGEQLRLLPAHDPRGDGSTLTSFVAGLHHGPVFTGHAGRQYGLQVDLSPLGAYTLLGLPTGELTDSGVALADLGNRRLDELGERLARIPDWAGRFALLDRVLAAWAEEGPAPAAEVRHAWHRLATSHGQVPVDALAAEVGWSRRHLTARFGTQAGLAPKAMARVLRFSRAVGMLGSPDGPTWAEAAALCGYYDQAHLNREFRTLAGCTPTEYFAAHLPDGGGVAG